MNNPTYEYDTKISSLKEKLEILNQDSRIITTKNNKITLFTSKDYDFSTYHYTFDPSTTNAIVMKSNGSFTVVDKMSNTVDDDIMQFTIKSILNDTGKYVVSLILMNNKQIDVSSSKSDLKLDDFIKEIYIRSPSGYSPFFIKIRSYIPDNLATFSNTVSFYSDSNYENLYDYFMLNPQTDVTQIPLKFKNDNKKHRIMSIRNSTNYYITLFKAIPDDPEFKKAYNSNGIYINFYGDVDNINKFINNEDLLDGIFIGAILIKKSVFSYSVPFNRLTTYDLTKTWDTAKYITGKLTVDNDVNYYDVSYIIFYSDRDYKNVIQKFAFDHRDIEISYSLDFKEIPIKQVLSIKNTTNFYIKLYHGTKENPRSGDFIKFKSSVSDIKQV